MLLSALLAAKVRCKAACYLSSSIISLSPHAPPVLPTLHPISLHTHPTSVVEVCLSLHPFIYTPVLTLFRPSLPPFLPSGTHTHTLLKPPTMVVSFLPRMHLVEYHEESWCPALLRQMLQDFLRFMWECFGLVNTVVPLISKVGWEEWREGGRDERWELLVGSSVRRERDGDSLCPLHPSHSLVHTLPPRPPFLPPSFFPFRPSRPQAPPTSSTSARVGVAPTDSSSPCSRRRWRSRQGRREGRMEQGTGRRRK